MGNFLTGRDAVQKYIGTVGGNAGQTTTKRVL